MARALWDSEIAQWVEHYRIVDSSVGRYNGILMWVTHYGIVV